MGGTIQLGGDVSQPREASEARLSELERRMTYMELQFAQKVPEFQATGVRVAELSSAFQAANVRLRTLELAIEALQAAEPPDVSTLLARLADIETRLSSVERSGNRRGRLSSRLASIEEKLDRLDPEEDAGGITE
jgi:chromosome segregation ATPase